MAVSHSCNHQRHCCPPIPITDLHNIVVLQDIAVLSDIAVIQYIAVLQNLAVFQYIAVIQDIAVLSDIAVRHCCPKTLLSQKLHSDCCPSQIHKNHIKTLLYLTVKTLLSSKMLLLIKTITDLRVIAAVFQP